MRQKAVFLTVVLALLSAPVFASTAFASPEQDRALEILDGRTSSHWGEDNLAWVVHYPESLVDPWVKSFAEKRKMTAEQMGQYRKAFTDELKSGAATAVMLSVHSFGLAPLTLSPIAKNVALIDSSGKRIQPMVYEKKLDTPIGGLMQGFIFFPLQKNDDFKIAVKGLIQERETIFAFGGSSGSGIATAPGGAVAEKKRQEQKAEQPKEVIVKIPSTKAPVAPPPVSPKTPEAPVVSRDEPEFSLAGETYPPTLPPAEQNAPPTPQTQQNRLPQEPPQPTLSPKQALDIFLKAWIAGDADRMYGLLTEESRGRISKDLFAKDVLGAGGFRQGLRDGYRVAWEGDSAKVTVSQKFLLMRTLSSRRLDFTEENGSPRIAW